MAERGDGRPVVHGADQPCARLVLAQAHQELDEVAQYLNFPGFLEDGAASVQAAHGEVNHRRLALLKRRLDPDNRFRLHQNVAPAGGPTCDDAAAPGHGDGVGGVRRSRDRRPADHPKCCRSRENSGTMSPWTSHTSPMVTASVRAWSRIAPTTSGTTPPTAEPPRRNSRASTRRTSVERGLPRGALDLARR